MGYEAGTAPGSLQAAHLSVTAAQLVFVGWAGKRGPDINCFARQCMCVGTRLGRLAGPGEAERVLHVHDRHSGKGVRL